MKKSVSKKKTLKVVPKKELEEFTVDRQRWIRGVDGDLARLQTEDGLRCCLGFLSLTCGATVGKITGVAMPWVVSNDLVTRMHFEKYSLTDLAEVNDDITLSEAAREKKLTKMFKANGWKVHFVGLRKLPMKLVALKKMRMAARGEKKTS